MSTADKIRKWLHWPNPRIARRVRCDRAYVRVVRQRTTQEGLPKTRTCDLPHYERYKEKRRQKRAA